MTIAGDALEKLIDSGWHWIVSETETFSDESWAMKWYSHLTEASAGRMLNACVANRRGARRAVWQEQETE